MDNSTIQTVLDLVIEYGASKHNRKKKELLKNIENLLTQQKEEEKEYGKPTETTDREEGTETSSASIEGTGSSGLYEGR